MKNGALSQQERYIKREMHDSIAPFVMCLLGLGFIPGAIICGIWGIKGDLATFTVFASYFVSLGICFAYTCKVQDSYIKKYPIETTIIHRHGIAPNLEEMDKEISFYRTHTEEECKDRAKELHFESLKSYCDYYDLQ